MVVTELTVSSEVGRGLVVCLVFVCVGGVEGLADFMIVDTTQLHCACSAGIKCRLAPLHCSSFFGCAEVEAFLHPLMVFVVFLKKTFLCVYVCFISILLLLLAFFSSKSEKQMVELD